MSSSIFLHCSLQFPPKQYHHHENLHSRAQLEQFKIIFDEWSSHEIDFLFPSRCGKRKKTVSSKLIKFELFKWDSLLFRSFASQLIQLLKDCSKFEKDSLAFDLSGKVLLNFKRKVKKLLTVHSFDCVSRHSWCGWIGFPSVNDYFETILLISRFNRNAFWRKIFAFEKHSKSI